jgi:hypothetical protein
LAPDGTDYEFRDQATNGQPKAPVSGGFNRGTIFTTADGTTATFISDWTIYETAYGLEPPAPDGYIKLKDGTQFRVDDGTIFSSSYACHMCCPNSVRNTWIDPVSLDIFTGDATSFRGVERDSTCYGALTPPYYIGDSWTTDNANVAGVSGIGSDADVTGVNSGTAIVTAHWDVYSYTSTYNFELGTDVCEESSETTAPTTPVQVAASPDHLKVLGDQQGFTTQLANGGQCATQYWIRPVNLQVVSQDSNGAPPVGNVPVEEQFASVSNNTYGNGQPQASGCPDHYDWHCDRHIH